MRADAITGWDSSGVAATVEYRQKAGAPSRVEKLTIVGFAERTM